MLRYFKLIVRASNNSKSSEEGISEFQKASHKNISKPLLKFVLPESLNLSNTNQRECPQLGANKMKVMPSSQQ